MQDFMKDRYGVDDLALAVGSAGVILALIGTVLSLRPVSIAAIVILVIDLLRIFSKDFEARRRENDAYRELLAKAPLIGSRVGGGRSRSGSKRPSGTDDLRRQARTAKKMWKERKTKAFLKCPKCGTMLAVPKGKGKMIVTCPKCRTRMETKS